ncbi:MAG TPA: helix-turn-helix transcriptional regulator [Candidatus Nitrosocosmicus sp.]|nr:helix-turn-helix transcriptional regulator [Candidatus Nitrosocosmicus sp.]
MRWVDAPIWVKVARNVKNCRKWKNLSKEQVASRAKIDLKRYKRIEREVVKDITIDEAFRMQKAMKVHQEEIIPILD